MCTCYMYPAFSGHPGWVWRDKHLEVNSLKLGVIDYSGTRNFRGTLTDLIRDYSIDVN